MTLKLVKTSFLFLSILIVIISCKKNSNEKKIPENNKNIASIATPKNMIWVAGKTFLQGAKNTDKFAMKREKPAHLVTVDGFYIDATEVTNKQFKEFVTATNYKTIAEREID